MNERPLIGIDVDGVCVDLLTAWLDMYNADYNDNLTPADITDWDLTLFVKPECGAKIYGYLARPDLYDHARPVEGALAGIQAIRDMGADVVFITTSADGQGDSKRAWMRRYGFLPNAKMDPNAAELCQWSEKHRMPIDLLIDDYIGNFTNLRCSGVLLAQPYNQERPEDFPFPRAHDWSQVTEMVDHFLKTGSLLTDMRQPRMATSRRI